ncbi:hypothetical protein [Vibrio furnissii]|uniref:hypothetical protein n=1 Tax=Vibrio furnissii TaxID=29494 RepID=UPI001EEC9760|nr:hypothetical protein [Vibrio furnissii]MCG6266781.1 hypothetical protein [Vibrio furnissii]
MFSGIDGVNGLGAPSRTSERPIATLMRGIRGKGYDESEIVHGISGVGVKYQEHTRFRLITVWQFAAKWVMQFWQKIILFHQYEVLMTSEL